MFEQLKLDNALCGPLKRTRKRRQQKVQFSAIFLDIMPLEKNRETPSASIVKQNIQKFKNENFAQI